MRGQPVARRAIAPLLAILVLGASVAAPLLDARERPGIRQVESEHDPAACAVLHDHAACTQLVKSFGQPSWGASTPAGVGVSSRGERVPPLVAFAHRTHSSAPSPRAPPPPHS